MRECSCTSPTRVRTSRSVRRSRCWWRPSGTTKFTWRYDTYDPQRPYWIDKLSGSPRLRTMIDAGADVDEVVGAWEGEVADFDDRRERYLLYTGRRG